jgi:ribonuclease-3
MSSAKIEERIGYVFKDKNLLFTAFVHRSFFNEHRDLITENNERLEFLGDSVLGVIVSDFLFHYFPQKPEGELSHLRAQVVEAKACAGYIQKLQIGEYVLLGKGERMNEGRGRETILADLFEAIVGAPSRRGDGRSKTVFPWPFPKRSRRWTQNPFSQLESRTTRLCTETSRLPSRIQS